MYTEFIHYKVYIYIVHIYVYIPGYYGNSVQRPIIRKTMEITLEMTNVIDHVLHT